MAYPTFNSGDVLAATDMNAVGLWLIKTQTVGTAVSSVEVTSAFSSTYQSYKIIYAGGTGSASGEGLKIKLGASTTAYYSGATYAIYSSGANGNVVNNNAFGEWRWVGSVDATFGAVMNIDVHNPFDSSRYTTFGGPFMVTDVAGSTGGVHKVNASYSSFTLSPQSGTLTGGTIRVYGYRN